MKNMLFISAAVVLIGAVSCNKTKVNSNRLDGGNWKVTELTVDGVSEAELPSWNISECDIYEQTCTGTWTNEEGGHADFAWQFRGKGKIFEIANQQSDFHGHADEEATMQCQNFSGVYDVVERGKKNMEFKTTAAIGYPGQSVVIRIEKQ